MTITTNINTNNELVIITMSFEEARILSSIIATGYYSTFMSAQADSVLQQLIDNLSLIPKSKS